LKNAAGFGVDEKYHESVHLGIAISGKNTKEDWKEQMQDSDFYNLKSIMSKIFTRFAINNAALKVKETADKAFVYGLDYFFGQKLIASIGSLSKKMLKELDVNQEVFYLVKN